MRANFTELTLNRYFRKQFIIFYKLSIKHQSTPSKLVPDLPRNRSHYIF